MGYVIAISLPTVIDRSLSFYILEKLQQRVSAALKVSFKEFAGVGKKERGEIIVSFLAMLELVKLGILNAQQSDTHGDILLDSDTVSTPSYE